MGRGMPAMVLRHPAPFTPYSLRRADHLPTVEHCVRMNSGFRMAIGPFRRGIAALALVAISCALPAFAQDDDDSQDPPDRVARLSYLQGDVSLQPAGAED